ncbi:MAG: FAD-dependent oxidoreductase, partial [Alphaproteobacteria bacterium]|nr:FAD-dependent oxidoreductase [Alphaproteobacteria bacterium]
MLSQIDRLQAFCHSRGMQNDVAHSSYTDTFYLRDMGAPDPYPVLQGTEEADVCIIGGGLAGLNTALGLLERGKSVVLVEQNRIAWGASGRAAGFVAKGFAAGQAALVKKLNLEKARELVNMTKSARALIKKRINDFNIECGPVRDGVLTVTWRDRPDEIQKYVDDANENFDLGFEYWTRDQVRAHCKTDKYYEGVYSKNDFQFNPLRYTHGLAAKVAQLGGKIFEESRATSIDRDGAGWKVTTSNGVVKSQYVVSCGAIYANGLDKRLEYAAFPVRTYSMSTEPIDADVLKSAIDTPHAIYDMRFCSDYYRILPGNRLLWGGRVS